MNPDNVAKESDPVLEYDPFAYGDMPFIGANRLERLEIWTGRLRFWCDKLAEDRTYYESLKSSELSPLYDAYGLLDEARHEVRQAESEVSDLRSELLYVLLPDYYFVRV